jgi:beta-lactamase class A
VAILWPPGRAPIIISVYITDTPASTDESNATIAAVSRAVAASLA